MSLQLHHHRDPFYDRFKRLRREMDDLKSPQMYIPHHREPFYDRFDRLRREMDNLMSPAMDMLENMRQLSLPRTILPTGDPNHFQMQVDVHQFAPEELHVKMLDNFVVVEAKHEERQDEYGYVSRQLVERFNIPDDVNPEEIEVDLSSDGVLVLNAPRHVKSLTTTERPLPINYTGQPALTHTPAMDLQKHAESTRKTGGRIAV